MLLNAFPLTHPGKWKIGIKGLDQDNDDIPATIFQRVELLYHLNNKDKFLMRSLTEEPFVFQGKTVHNFSLNITKKPGLQQYKKIPKNKLLLFVYILCGITASHHSLSSMTSPTQGKDRIHLL